jgi:hypothetical protein
MVVQNRCAVSRPHDGDFRVGNQVKLTYPRDEQLALGEPVAFRLLGDAIDFRASGMCRLPTQTQG